MVSASIAGRPITVEFLDSHVLGPTAMERNEKRGWILTSLSPSHDCTSTALEWSIHNYSAFALLIYRRSDVRVSLVNELIWAVAFVVLSEDMSVPALLHSMEERCVLSGSWNDDDMGMTMLMRIIQAASRCHSITERHAPQGLLEA